MGIIVLNFNITSVLRNILCRIVMTNWKNRLNFEKDCGSKLLFFLRV